MKTSTNPDRIKVYLNAIPGAVAGAKGHNQTFTVAVALVNGFALGESEALEWLTKYNQKCDPTWSDKELLHKIKSAMAATHKKPRGHLLNDRKPGASVYKNVITTKRPERAKAKPLELAAKENVLPTPIKSPTIELLKAAFREGESICIEPAVYTERDLQTLLDDDASFEGNFMGDCEREKEWPPARPSGKAMFKTREQWCEIFDAKPDSLVNGGVPGIFVVVNPFPKNARQRTDDAVEQFRHVLLEFDTISKEAQWSVIKESNVPCSAVIDSGGKSVHAWVRVDAATRDEYDHRAKKLFEIFEPYKPDTNCGNRARLSRLAGARRHVTTQNLIAVDMGAKSFEEWASESGDHSFMQRHSLHDATHETPPKSDENEPPMLILPSMGRTITESATELYQLIGPKHEIFYRGGAVVSLTLNDAGEYILEPLRPSAARSLFETYAKFFAYRIGKSGEQVLKPIPMPEETAKALLDCHVASEILPTINSVVDCPVLTEIAGVLKTQGKGYSKELGLLVTKGDKVPDVPLDTAVQSLLELLGSFDFQTPGDKSRAMAAQLTPALKMGRLIQERVPVDVAEANQSQTGKTYRHKMTAGIYGESPSIVPPKTKGVGGIEESFSQKCVNGRPFIQLDNFRGKLDCPFLETFQTAGHSFACRIPYHGEIQVDPHCFFIQLTSNGVETTPDFANRSCIVRIRKREGVQFPDTLGRIKSRRSFYLGSVFSIIREWHRQGKQRTTETSHDFREWCQTLDWIVQHICGMAPLMEGHTEAKERVSNPILNFLRSIAIEAEAADRLGESFTATQLVELASESDVDIPGLDGGAASGDAKAGRSLGVKLGRVFKNCDVVPVDAFTITRKVEKQTRTEGSGGSFDSKTYTFERLRSKCSKTLYN